MNLLVDHHLRDHAVGYALLQVKHDAELRERKRVVVRRVGEEVGAKRLALDLILQHILHFLSGVLARNEVPNVHLVEDKVRAPLPIARCEGLGRGEHVIAHVLGWASEHLAVEKVHILPEVARDDARPFAELLGGHVWHFEQHGGGEVAPLEQLEVDVHVVWRLPAALGLLLLRVLVRVAHRLDTLCEQLLVARRADVREALVRLEDEAEAERAEAEHDHGAIEEDLGGHVRVPDVLLQVRHEEQIARIVEPVVKRVVSDVAEHGARACAVIAMLVDDAVAKLLDQHGLVLEHCVDRRLAAHGRRMEGLRLDFGAERRRWTKASRVEVSVLAPLLGELLGLEHGLGDRVVLVVGVLDAEQRHDSSLPHIAHALVVLLRGRAEMRELGLHAEASHVLGRVRVDRDERLCVLLLEALDEGDEVPDDLDRVLVFAVAVALGLLGWLLLLFRQVLERTLLREDHVGHVVLAEHAEHKVFLRVQDVHDAREVVVARAPRLEVEVRVHVALRVEVGRDKVEEGRDLDLGAETARGAGEHREVAVDLARVHVAPAALRDDLGDLAAELARSDVLSDGVGRGLSLLHLLLGLLLELLLGALRLGRLLLRGVFAHSRVSHGVDLEPLGAALQRRVHAAVVAVRVGRRVALPLVRVHLVERLLLLGLILGSVRVRVGR
mmetsp:Transcript_10319/g.27114  ORF Transcript_10319/g.27114 Transcript_10319/m.27114 type:complete len:668 (+) Transcript_10319:223-2226(+)